MRHVFSLMLSCAVTAGGQQLATIHSGVPASAPGQQPAQHPTSPLSRVSRTSFESQDGRGSRTSQEQPEAALPPLHKPAHGMFPHSTQCPFTPYSATGPILFPILLAKASSIAPLPQAPSCISDMLQQHDADFSCLFWLFLALSCVYTVDAVAAGKAAAAPGGVVSLQARAGLGHMPKVSSFGSLPHSLSDQSMQRKSQELEQPPQPFTSQLGKAESIASTAVRTADKINVSLQHALLAAKMLIMAVCILGACARPKGLLIPSAPATTKGVCFACCQGC